MLMLRRSVGACLLIGAVLASAPVTFSHAGEITFVEWDSIYSQINVRYFDTEGQKVICTGFYKDKPVGAGSAFFRNGIAAVEISMPKGARADSENTTVRCRTE